MKERTPDHRRKSTVWALAALLAMTLGFAIEAAIITGCDSQGRRHTFILDDDTGELTGHIYTDPNHESCQ